MNKIQRKRKGQRRRQKDRKYDLIEEVKSFIFQTFGRCIFYTFFK